MFSSNQAEPENKFTIDFLAKHHPDFVDHYNRFIKPHVDEFEQKRQEALNEVGCRKTKGIKLKALGAVVGILVVFAFKNVSGSAVLFVMIFLWLLIYVWCNQPISKYKQSVYQVIFPNVFSFFGQDYQYKERPDIGVERFSPSQLIPSHDSESSSNYVVGSYDGVSLELMTSALTKQDSRNNSYNVFEGLLINLRMNKDFSGTTLLEHNHGGVFEFFGNLVSSLERVHLEDSDFEKEFTVHSNDQVEARYLLTPTFMERLIKLSALFSNKIQCSFYNKNSLLILIPTNKRFFTISSVYVKDNFIEDVDVIFQQMYQIFNIIKILKLDKKTGI